ncbi:MAG: hypothetical protein QOI26_340 [Pseudonocardiales bacterium]|nr:hypothetical protein [Pseudonocardiales bacterium]
MTGRIVVTAGPTISPAEIRREVPSAEIRAPIAFGDAFGYGLTAGDRLLIIDGLFLHRPSVRHKELLGLLDDGVTVAGASSMGALRAAELHPFGMLGYGEIFAGYRDGRLEADDEVAMVHGSPQDEYPVFVDALVNIRATLSHAESIGLLSASDTVAMVAAARALPFTARHWITLLSEADLPRELAPALRDLRQDVKHRDAVLALRHFRDQVDAPLRPQVPETIWSVRWRQRYGGLADVSDVDVLNFVRLCAESEWRYLACLRQIANWHGRPASEVDPGPADIRRLESIAHEYLQQLGLCGPAGLPAAVLAEWLEQHELQHAAARPEFGSALLASRTLIQFPSLPAIEHELSLLRQDYRYSFWAAETARLIGIGHHLAAGRPDLDLTRPRPDRLRTLFERFWATGNFRIEASRRGFTSERAFHAAAVPFAGAIASGAMRRVDVGWLGRPSWNLQADSA